MFPCEIREYPVRPALAVRFFAPVQDLPIQFGRVYGMIMEYMKEIGAEDAGGAFAIYHNMNMEKLDVEAGFSVSKAKPSKGNISAIEIPSGLYAVCHYTGPYDKMPPAYRELQQFAKDRGYLTGQIAYEWYLTGPDVPPQAMKTDIAFPVTRISEKAKA